MNHVQGTRKVSVSWEETFAKLNMAGSTPLLVRQRSNRSVRSFSCVVVVEMDHIGWCEE